MPTSTPLKQHFKKIAITCGDPLGIGFEVVCKALHAMGPQKQVVFFMYRDAQQKNLQPRYFKFYFNLLQKKFLLRTFADSEAALAYVNESIKNNSLPQNILIDLALNSTAAEWVFSAAGACLSKQFSGLVTAPLSKTLIKKSGFSSLGHTGIFRSLCPRVTLHMAFIGKNFNVLLASDHVPLAKVPKFLTRKRINAALAAARELKKITGKITHSNKKIALLGLNPHAGEAGLIGSFEKNTLKNLPLGVAGPLVPDAAFFPINWKKYSVFVCLYHDQGLIPFKMIHGQDSGVHITLGLPFVRTSVDHGTAFDIYNKNVANFSSMLDSIRLNLKLVRG